jgi:putative copper export protein/mono/diheme cytochrome c family protein
MSTVAILVAVLRGVHLAALISLFGTLLFLATVLPSVGGDVSATRVALQRLARTSAVSCMVVGGLWLTMETAAIADADSVMMTLHALPVVMLRTQFGHWLLVRGVLLLATLVAMRRGSTIAIFLAGAALTVQPLLGHAGAIGGSLGIGLMTSEALHMLAAGAWLGGLLPLYIAIGTLRDEQAAVACNNFTPIGLSAVLVLAGTALVQTAEFMGGMPGLFGTAYGHIALVKLGAFVVLLALAALNRFVFTHRMIEAISINDRRHMRYSVATEAIIGTLVVITAGLLASQTPGTHEQPIWPFDWRPSLIALVDPDLRHEVVGALVACAGAVLAMGIGIVWRRIRWAALAISFVLLFLSVPHLDLLFVSAYPSSFFTSPTEFAATAIAHGARLFAANCVSCHGAHGRGDGPAARSLPVKPADLTAEHLWSHSDGELYWFISHGFQSPEGSTTMPGFAGILSDEARWGLIDYLRAHNAGESMHSTGKWLHPVPVPQFDAVCAQGRMVDLDDLRGRMLRIIATSDEEQAAPVLPAQDGVTTILVLRDHVGRRGASDCIASEPDTWTALSIILGVLPGALAGSQILVDRNDWLRLAWRPGDSDDWLDPRIIEARIRDIATHPLAIDTGVPPHRH